MQEVNQIFYPFDAEAICNIKIPRENVEDCLAWNYEKTGMFTVKSAYKLAYSLKSQSGTRASCSSNEPYD